MGGGPLGTGLLPALLLSEVSAEVSPGGVGVELVVDPGEGVLCGCAV